MEAFSYSWEISLQAASIFREKATATIVMLCPLQITPLNLSTVLFCSWLVMIKKGLLDCFTRCLNWPTLTQKLIKIQQPNQSEKLYSQRHFPFGETVTEKLKKIKFLQICLNFSLTIKPITLNELDLEILSYSLD